MTNYPEIFKNLAIRVVISAPFIVFAVKTGNPILAIVAGLILGPAVARLFAEPVGKLFYPNQRFSRPQPMYSIPASLRAQGSYEAAIAGYHKIAKDYPGDLKPYIEMIDIAVVDLKDADQAKRIFRKALTTLTSEDDKAALTRIYKATITRLEGDPKWIREQKERTLSTPDLKNQVPVDEPDGRHERRFHAGGDVPDWKGE